MTKSASARAQFWALAGVLWIAITYTFQEFGVNVSEELVTIWGGVYMAVLRLGEAVFDSRRSV